MRTLFADLPEACDNTLVIANVAPICRPHANRFCPPSRPAKGRSEEEELRAQAKAGLKARLDAAGINDRKTYEDRLDFELE